MRLERIDVIALLGVLVVCVGLYSSLFSSGRYTYDEADYMFAASQGFYANYMDRNTLPLTRFIALGLDRGFQEEQRTSLSELIRDSGDVAFYRHFHGPLSSYGLVLWRYFVPDNEYWVRMVSLLFFVATITAVYLGCLTLAGRTPALLASVMLLSSYSSMVTATEISTHGAYVLAASISLFFMARWLQSQELRYGYGAVIALAVACTASEYAPLVLLTLIACMALHRRTLFHGWSRARFRNALGWSAVLFVATIFVVWPGALLKQTLVKNYLFMGYLALGRQGEFGTEGFAHVWGHRLSNAPVEYAVVVLATLAAFSLLKKHGWILPFLIYAGLMLAATVRITTSAERYISSLLPPLHIVSAVVIWHYARRLAPAWRAAVTGLILMAFVLQAVSHARTIRARSSETRQEDHVVSYFLMDRTSGDEHILTTSEFLPTLHYYFPTRTFQSYSDEGDMIATLRRSSFNGVITKGRDQSLLERELAKHFVVQRETITSASTPEESVVYFRILRRTPESL